MSYCLQDKRSQRNEVWARWRSPEFIPDIPCAISWGKRPRIGLTLGEWGIVKGFALKSSRNPLASSPRPCRAGRWLAFYCSNCLQIDSLQLLFFKALTATACTLFSPHSRLHAGKLKSSQFNTYNIYSLHLHTTTW